jgi:NADPH:quinone reductase-like Zn-dependent oxidoreductase
MAKSFGAEVTGVDSARKLDMCRSIGADHVIDYAQEDFTRSGERYDLILDVSATHSIFDYARALRPGGTYLVAGGRMLQPLFLGPWISALGSKEMGVLRVQPNKRDLNVVGERFEAGKVVPVIDRRFPLAEVPEALRYFGDGLARGKVVIMM